MSGKLLISPHITFKKIAAQGERAPRTYLLHSDFFYTVPFIKKHQKSICKPSYAKCTCAGSSASTSS